MREKCLDWFPEPDGAMDVRLKILNGAKTGQALAIRASKFFIGRAEDCHLRPKSDLISRHHCVVVIDDPAIVVRDLGSRNGTFVNGEAVTGESELRDGDQLKIGPLEFQVELKQDSPAKKRPKVNSIKEAAARTAEGSSHDDVDVSDWLGDGEDQQSAHETVEVQAAETEEIALSDTDVPKQDEPTPLEPENTTENSPPRPPKSVTPQAGDSKEAAADVLRKFFKRR